MSVALRVAVAALMWCVATEAFAGSYLRVVSWNLRHEGWSGETNYAGDAAQLWKQFGTSSSSPNGCDLVLLQEVMSTSAAQGIAQALTQLSGTTWGYAVTPLIGRTSYKEQYAVLYRTDVVSLLSSSVYSDSGDKFEREPQIVKVRQKATGADFTFINWHTIWGTSAQRQAEASAIADVFKSIQNASTADEDVILLGDHNQSATASAWSRLKSTSVVSPVVSNRVDLLTTINSAGSYVSAYDHFWLQASYLTEYSSSGRDYVASPSSLYGLSDHAPVWIKFYSTSDTD